MEAQNLEFRLSEPDEQVVRYYKCTRFSPLLSPPTIGYLTVTNKRVVFHSSGRSLWGKSTLMDEMPLEDVAGLSVYDGFSFNWVLFGIFTVVMLFITAVVALFPLVLGYLLALVLAMPFTVARLFASSLVPETIREQVFKQLDTLFSGRVKTKNYLDPYRPYFLIPFYIGLALLTGLITLTANFGLPLSCALWLLLLGVYYVIFKNVFGGRRTFSLVIASKTTKGAGIFIPGDSLQLLSTRDTTALRSLGAGPAEDAGQVRRELGALLMDIQQLGDLGIQKWKK